MRVRTKYRRTFSTNGSVAKCSSLGTAGDYSDMPADQIDFPQVCKYSKTANGTPAFRLNRAVDFDV
jgi:hypothetical protein